MFANYGEHVNVILHRNPGTSQRLIGGRAALSREGSQPHCFVRRTCSQALLTFKLQETKTAFFFIFQE